METKDIMDEVEKVPRKWTTKSLGQKHALDKFYTKPEIAAYFIQKSGLSSFTTVIEPSAGGGAFSSQIPNCIAFDLKPEADGIMQQDWLQYNHPDKPNEKVLIIGNPPFGNKNSLALKFINHAAKFADRIAFILPISFKKESLKEQINPNLHLVYEEDVPRNSFTLNGNDYGVKCVFQIWDRKAEVRKRMTREELNSNNLFAYVKRTDAPDAVIQRVGARAGKVTVDFEHRSSHSNHFIRFHHCSDRERISEIVELLNSIDYPSKDFTVGPRSLSKRELNSAINELFPNPDD